MCDSQVWGAEFDCPHGLGRQRGKEMEKQNTWVVGQVVRFKSSAGRHVFHSGGMAYEIENGMMGVIESKDEHGYLRVLFFAYPRCEFERFPPTTSLLETVGL